MSHNIWSDVVPFVAHEAFNCEDTVDFSQLPVDSIKMISAAGYTDGEWLLDAGNLALYEVHKNNIMTSGITANGWKHIRPGRLAGKLGTKNILRGDCWAKDRYEVCIVTESPFSNLGEHRNAVCAIDRSSLEEFLKNFNKTQKIHSNDSVSQSG